MQHCRSIFGGSFDVGQNAQVGVVVSREKVEIEFDLERTVENLMKFLKGRVVWICRDDRGLKKKKE
jgi:hypothetical protein